MWLGGDGVHVVLGNEILKQKFQVSGLKFKAKENSFKFKVSG